MSNKTDAEMKEILAKARTGVIVAASANVLKAQEECGWRRRGVERAERELATARERHAEAKSKYDAAIAEVRENIDRFYEDVADEPDVPVEPDVPDAEELSETPAESAETKPFGWSSRKSPWSLFGGRW